MEYFIHAKFKNETSLKLYEDDTDIRIEVDRNFNPLLCESDLLKRFKELVAKTKQLRFEGKINQFYLLEAVASDGVQSQIIARWKA